MKNQLEILNEICNKAGWNKPYIQEAVEQLKEELEQSDETVSVSVSFEEGSDE